MDRYNKQIVTMETTSKSEANKMVVNLPLGQVCRLDQVSTGSILCMPSCQLSGQCHELVAFLVSACDGIRAACKGVYTPEEIPKKKKIEREICLEY